MKTPGKAVTIVFSLPGLPTPQRRSWSPLPESRRLPEGSKKTVKVKERQCAGGEKAVQRPWKAKERQ